MQQRIFTGIHKFIVGMTKSGKTWFAVENMLAAPWPVFFFNSQHYDNPHIKPMLVMDHSYDVNDIIRCLEKGEKINYLPSTNRSYAKEELELITGAIFFKRPFTEDKPFVYAIDEAQIFARQGSKSERIVDVATSGRAFGFKGWFLSQRPAMVDKDIYTQCSQHFIFATEAEAEYYKNKGIDYEKIKSIVGQDPEQHLYAIYESGQIDGPFKE